MKRISNKIFNRRVFASVLCLAVMVSLVASGLTVLAPIPSSTAQTNPQTTDIFTGQFIPAYYGAAYDPTEAYKQMAGMEVLVFGYDTWGTIVNNFAYRTQIKANGSFQAAGLPNASHYGICLNVSDTDLSAVFRAPKPEDNLQGTFAYSQATFAKETPNVNTQTGKPAQFFPFHGDGSCRVFVTSSRTVDIANHINIFPLVPQTVLNVIIKDPDNSADIATRNTPYEIYAQRVSTLMNSSEAQSTNCDSALSGSCADSTSPKPLTNGPVIRGRSIQYNPVDSGGARCGTATIFQSFAPIGTYAVTYWRPDTREADNKVTYLNYDGTKPLNTPYNGIAIEKAITRLSQIEPVENPWIKRSKDCVNATPTAGQASPFWYSETGGAHVWGMVFKGTNGVKVGLDSGDATTVSISNDTNLQFVNPQTRQCSNSSSGTVDGKYSLFMFSTCVRGQANLSGSTSSSSQINIISGNLLSGEAITPKSVKVSVNGAEGPARKDVSIIAEGVGPVTGQLTKGGKPLAHTYLDITKGSQTFKKVIMTDEHGFFNIPHAYLNLNNPSQTSLKVSGKNGAVINIQTTQKITADRTIDLGTIALNDTPTSPITSFLASININSLLNIFKIPVAYALYEDQPSEWSLDRENGSFGNDNWVFYLNTATLTGTTKNAFTPSNYKLRDVEIGVPEAYLSFMKCLSSDDAEVSDTCVKKVENAQQAVGNSTVQADAFQAAYNDAVLFERNESQDNLTREGSAIVGQDQGANDVSSGYGKGIVTATGKSNEGIIGVALQPSELIADKPIVPYLLHLLGPEPVSFTLRIKFELKDDVTLVTPAKIETNTGTSGQTDQSQPDRVLEGDFPVLMSLADDGRVTVSYMQPALVPDNPKCSSASIWDGVTTWIKSSLCELVSAGIQGIQKMFDILADNILVINPISYSVIRDFWNVVRNVVNAMAILILILAGVAIMLRYDTKTFSIQRILPGLVITIVLANFSILIMQVAIDITNVLGFGGYKFLIQALQSDTNQITGAGLQAAAAGIGTLGAGVLVFIMSMGGGTSLLIGMLIFVLGVLIFFFYIIARILIDFCLRMAMLWLCIIFAPAALAARILPGTNNFYNRWKSMVFGTLAAQVALAFTLAVAIGMVNQSVTNPNGLQAIIIFALAFALFYFATIIPRKAAAVVGVDVTAGMSNMIQKGFNATRGRVQLATQKTLQARADRETMKARQDYQDTNWIGKRTFGIRDSIANSGGVAGMLGVGAEEQEKIRHDALDNAAKKEKLAADRLLYRNNPQIEHNEMIDIMDQKRLEGQKDIETKRIRYSDDEAMQLRAFERDQEFLDTASKENQQLNISGIRADYQDELAFRRDQDKLNAESEAETKLMQDKKIKRAEDGRLAAGLDSLQEQIRDQKHKDALEETRGQLKEAVIKSENPESTESMRNFRTQQKIATLKGQLDAEQATIETEGLRKALLEDAQEKPLEGVLSQSLRINMRTSIAEGNPTITMMQTVDPAVRLDDARGNQIIGANRAEFVNAIKTQMLNRNITLTPDQKEAYANKLWETIGNADPAIASSRPVRTSFATQADYDTAVLAHDALTAQKFKTMGDFNNTISTLKPAAVTEALVSAGNAPSAVDILNPIKQKEAFSKAIYDSAARARDNSDPAAQAQIRFNRIQAMSKSAARNQIPETGVPATVVAPTLQYSTNADLWRGLNGYPKLTPPATFPPTVDMVKLNRALETLRKVHAQATRDSSIVLSDQARQSYEDAVLDLQSLGYTT